MLPKVNIFTRSLPNVLQATVNRQVHFQVGKNGEKIVISHRHNIRSKREEWQNVRPMGKEKELREINRIERDERLHCDPREAKMTAMRKMDSLKSKLELAGFCRDRKSYNPPEDVESRLNNLFQTVFNTTDGSFELSDPEKKFTILVKCGREFDHEVSNASLHELKTLDNIREFYQTPVRGVNSYDHMVNQSSNLPKNLHIIPEALRFNPETDTMFDGVDAFPGTAGQIVGLRAKKRYAPKPLKFEWPDI